MNTRKRNIYSQFIQENDTIIEIFHKDIWIILGEIISWGIVIVLWTIAYHQANTYNAFGLQDDFSFSIYMVGMVLLW